MKKLYPEIESHLNTLRQNVSLPARRQEILQEIADYISCKHLMNETAALIFICTQNSRRSHLTQIWASAAAHYYGIDNVLTFSGGVETTTFHPNTIEALERAGCHIDKVGEKNPICLVRFSDSHRGIQAFSKKYNDKTNPNQRFCAVMTCADADEACPVVLGMDQRISLTYKDPKFADGTSSEKATYDAICRQIVLEMFYTMDQVKYL